MSRLQYVLASLCIAALACWLPGCATESATPTEVTAPLSLGGSWWGGVLTKATRSTGLALEVIHDGTGWLLGKNKVEIEQIGDVEQIDGKRLAKFKITVAQSSESYSANIDQIECDEFGLPTEQSQEKMSEAVEKIKVMLGKLQH